MNAPIYKESAHIPDQDGRWRWMWEAANRGADATGAKYFEIDFDRNAMTVTIRGYLEKSDGSAEA